MCVLAVFCVIALIVSPRLNVGLSLSIIQEDTMFFLQLNKEQLHYIILDQFMILMTQYGRELVWPMTILFLFIFGGAVGKKAAIIMAFAMIVLIPIGIISKEIVARPRPFIPDTEVILAADSQYAYPSGHSMIVAAGAVVIIVMLNFSNNSSPSWKKKAISIALAIEAAIVCFSRIYVGAHFILDVVGGILLGVGIALLFISQSRRIDNLYTIIARSLKANKRK
jgi:membrane-associated phospholipid phosphatase